MANLIQLLPDHIANQIAAGEVVQRPASVVKELLENSVDAGSTEIKLILKDAGKALIQVIDNGCGMSEIDARMSFERHATSKIREAEDLFAIRTMGFRGEAMASIAAVAQVELQTRRRNIDLGSKLVVEASDLKLQESCACPVGTSVSVKNLFYNIPARRNFLKSNQVEIKHIIDEFQHIALAHPDIHFSLHHNGSEQFHLPPGNLRQRIVQLFGSKCNKMLIPIDEDTEVVSIGGYVGKPEYSKKTRGEQFFFVNSRFIKSNYLNHAVLSAFEEVLPKEQFPLYVIFLEIDPHRIDINVHPTKQEIKFEDDRLIYNYLKVAIRHSLAQNAVTPSLDFEQSIAITRAIDGIDPTTFSKYRPSEENTNLSLSSMPREKESISVGGFKPTKDPQTASNLKHWHSLYEDLQSPIRKSDIKAEAELTELDSILPVQVKLYQYKRQYIISPMKTGMMLIHQQYAHERILYEEYKQLFDKQAVIVQQLLFPKTLEFSASDAALLRMYQQELIAIGFDVQEFGGNSFILHGLPANLSEQDNLNLIELFLEQCKQDTDFKLDFKDKMAKLLAKNTAIKKGKMLGEEEMQNLLDRLFACETPTHNPSGKKCFVLLEHEELEKKFI